MKTDDLPEIIEIIDDDTSGAFADRVAAGPIVDSGGPKWIAPVAGLVLLALIGYGVVTSSSSQRPPEVAPSSTSSVPPPTTRPVPTTVAKLEPPVPYYSADLPREFRVWQAEMAPVGPTIVDSTWYQLWAAQGATADSGTWFSVRYFSGYGEIWAPDAYRMQTPRGIVAISRLPSGVVAASLADGPSLVSVNAFGMSDDEVAALVGGMTVNTRLPRTVQIDPSFTAGFELVSEIDPWTAVSGPAEEQVSFATPDQSRYVLLTASTKSFTGVPGQLVPDRRTALTFLLARATSFTVDGHQAIVGQVIDNPDFTLATWDAGDHYVVVAGTVTVPELMSIAQTVRQIPEEAWNGMRFQAAANAAEPQPDQNIDQNQQWPVSFGTDASGSDWRVDALVADFGAQRQVVWQWLDGGFSTDRGTEAQIDTFADSKRTYVFGQLPHAVASTAELRITRDGAETVTVPFNDVDPNLDRALAAYAFSELGPFVATIVGADGAVLDSWEPG